MSTVNERIFMNQVACYKRPEKWEPWERNISNWHQCLERSVTMSTAYNECIFMNQVACYKRDLVYCEVQMLQDIRSKESKLKDGNEQWYERSSECIKL